ncbi:tetratricopeptide repeat protein [Elusimicrobiota bacterium]
MSPGIIKSVLSWHRICIPGENSINQLEHSSSKADVYWLLGEIALLENKPQKAIELLKKCLDIHPWHNNANYSIATVYESMGNQDLANRYMMRDKKINPKKT